MKSIIKNFLPNTDKKIFCFTDMKNIKIEGVRPVEIEHQEWPYVTLYRYKNILKVKKELEEYDKIIYIDSDMYVNEVITEEEFFCHDKKYFGVQHPGFIGKVPFPVRAMDGHFCRGDG